MYKRQHQYLADHRTQLSNCYSLAYTTLTDAGVSVTATESGLCLWIDLRDVIRTPNAEGELELYQHLLHSHRVHISPGSGFHTAESGFFRLCFSHDEMILLEGLKRLTDGIASFAEESQSAAIAL